MTTTIKLRDNTKATFVETPTSKMLFSENYKFRFNKQNGVFMRWGRMLSDDGDLQVGLPEIADIEISTICSGVGKLCRFCYKANTPKGKNMSFDLFKRIFDKLPVTITQIAFGIGDIDSNPDMWDIFDYAKINGVIPNVTVNGLGITKEVAKRLASTCGAVAVSLYDKEVTYNAVEALAKAGLEQTNIHCMISEETYHNAIGVINDRVSDTRLIGLRAIVLLSLKQKGRGKKGFTRLSDEKFKGLVDLAFDKKVGIGFDSCSATKFMKSVENHPSHAMLESLAEPCESAIYSLYINVEGKYFPCSFIEGTTDWEEGIDVATSNDFLKDVWWNKKTLKFKDSVIVCRDKYEACPVYNV